MKKTIMGVLSAAALLGGAATIAEAGTNFTLFFGVPYYDQQMGSDYRFYPNRGWYRGDVRPGYRRMSCNQARHIVQDEGFRRVVARDCEGRTYSFSARRSGHRFIVYVNSRTGATWWS